MGILDKILGRGDPTDALFAAAAQSNVVEVRKALARNADPNAREPSEGQMPLHVAIRRKWKRQHSEPGMTFRTRADLTDVTNTVRMLLEAGAIPDSADNDGITPLHWAAGKGLTNIVRLLIEAGANVNARDSSLYTPIHQAVSSSSSHLEVARMLCEAGADPNSRSIHGETPLTLVEGNRAVPSNHEDPHGPLKKLLRDHRAVS